MDLRAGSSPPSQRLVLLVGRAGWLFFVLLNIVIFILVEYDPTARTVVHIYRRASLGWWQGQDIFGGGIGGFIYLPTFAVLYTPFAVLGAHVGDELWRLFSNAVLTYALWSALKLILPTVRRERLVLVLGAVFLIMLPSGLGTLRNGQATTLLYALMLLAAVGIAKERWWQAAWLLALAFAIKPLAIVYLLLAAVLYPKLALRLVVANVVLLLIPLINPHPIQAAHLYMLGIHKVLVAGAPDEGHWADITGLLDPIGMVLSDRTLTVIRLVAAALTLGLGVVARRRNGPVDGALAVLALSIVYLMLMNPRTETQTYLMLGSTIALYAVTVTHRENNTRLGWLLGLSGVGFMVVQASSQATELWLQPIYCLLFIPFLVARCFSEARIAAAD